MYALTSEQKQVALHPLGQHARVLAVAGSGKSTTMAHRIQYLIQEHSVQPASIQVLMFNSLARKQFDRQLSNLNIPAGSCPKVDTFHSFSFQLINQLIEEGLLPANTTYWLADKSELIWLTVKKAITKLEKQHLIPPMMVDPDAALTAIGLWKGSLITPLKARRRGNIPLAFVYDEFEKMRLNSSAFTFDDFIPEAIQILEKHPEIKQRICSPLRFLIIDEYQDINYGQQRLIELLAGNQADVMVVGDDDQTIYEWRGARPNYIIRDFQQVFDNKPLADYRLSRSFRFGPVIAQLAANTIACNSKRVQKPLIAFQADKPGFVNIFSGGHEAVRELAEQAEALLRVDHVPPSEIIVLGRLFAQLDNLEMEFLARGIPYRVDGQSPFFKRQEIKTLLDYIHLARGYQEPLQNQHEKWLLSVANKPSRMLSHHLLTSLCYSAQRKNLSLRQLLENACYSTTFNLQPWQVKKLLDLYHFLEELFDEVNKKNLLAGKLLEWMVDRLNYLGHFQDYYGPGVHSEEKQQVVKNFITYVSCRKLRVNALLDHLNELDTAQGKPESELITFTTIFRTKGLEYDYILLPSCNENTLPYLRNVPEAVPDFLPRSEALEAERRLFYVALTRARKGVLISTSEQPSRFLKEMDLENTTRVMSSLRWLAEGGKGAREELLQQLEVYPEQNGSLNNLLDGYLPDLAQEQLANTIKQNLKAAVLH